MKVSETSASKGYNRFHSIDDLPLDPLEKCAVLEWLARKLWVIIEESSGYPDYYGKSYDPLVVEMGIAHSYVFDLEDEGRHHPFDSLEHLEQMLVDETISRLLYRNEGRPLTCETCGKEYPDLKKAIRKRGLWWCSGCGKEGLDVFPAKGKLLPKSLLGKDIW